MESYSIFIVSAPGGHGFVADQIADRLKLPSLRINTNLREKWYKVEETNNISIVESNRDFNLFLQLIIAFILVTKYKPKFIISTGAGVAIPFFIVGRILGKRLYYIESQTHFLKLSLTGKIVKYLADSVIVRSRLMKSKGKVLNLR